jgi:hypothetical protein
MQTLRPAAVILLLLGLALGCSREHEKMLGSFPVLPVITEATLFTEAGDVVPDDEQVYVAGNGDTLQVGDPLLQRVRLRWEMPDGSEPDSFRVYVGLLYENPYATVDTIAWHANVAGMEYVYQDPSLALRDPVTCDMIGMCDSLYTYAYFRISAVSAGEDGLRSRRVTPTW